ncbi:MAG: hypothetical protein ACI9N9_002474 [Enterobacterales bacterium]
MKEIDKKKHRKNNKTVYRRWHRRLGLIASIFLLNLAITGIVLNHYDAMELDKHYIKSSWLLNWYGVGKPQEIFCLNEDNSSICEAGELIFLNNENNQLSLLASDSGRMLSLFINDSELILVTQKQVLLYTSNFKMIESFNVTEQLSEVIQTAFLHTNNNKQLLLSTNKQQWILDLDSFELTKTTAIQTPLIGITNSSINKKPEKLKDSELKERLGLSYQQHQISYLKFTQDMHSGQILSISGKLLADLAAFSIILLALSGFIMWKKKNNGTSNK